jgi:hypothetical protein
MAFIELKEVVECISSKQQLEVLHQDGTPTNITQASHMIMINEVHSNPLASLTVSTIAIGE